MKSAKFSRHALASGLRCALPKPGASARRLIPHFELDETPVTMNFCNTKVRQPSMMPKINRIENTANVGEDA
jgi:hypothetical protein